jgi:hypothetical protein
LYDELKAKLDPRGAFPEIFQKVCKAGAASWSQARKSVGEPKQAAAAVADAAKEQRRQPKVKVKAKSKASRSKSR